MDTKEIRKEIDDLLCEAQEYYRRTDKPVLAEYVSEVLQDDRKKYRIIDELVSMITAIS